MALGVFSHTLEGISLITPNIISTTSATTTSLVPMNITSYIPASSIETGYISAPSYFRSINSDLTISSSSPHSHLLPSSSFSSDTPVNSNTFPDLVYTATQFCDSLIHKGNHTHDNCDPDIDSIAYQSLRTPKHLKHSSNLLLETGAAPRAAGTSVTKSQTTITSLSPIMVHMDKESTIQPRQQMTPSLLPHVNDKS